MKTIEKKQSRFELRLSTEDKMLFERASSISGHKTLASYITSIVRERTRKILKEQERILASEKDKEIFFNAILSNNEPGKKLKKASEKYLKSQSV